MRWILLDNYEVAEQTPTPGTRITQTVTNEIRGVVYTETRSIGLMAKLKTP